MMPTQSTAVQRRDDQEGFWYNDRDEKTRSSARAVVSVVKDIVRPNSVVDVGCGVGTWLDEFARQGVQRVCGLDGDHVDRRRLVIDSERFIACDLTNPPKGNEEWDLAVSLEVAEHLPEENAHEFVKYLCGLAPAVLFSAAIPGQGGYKHLNEQWPDYWIQMFEEQQYVPLDVVRWRVWDHDDVLPWYAQNTFLFVNRTHELAAQAADNNPVSIVHPRMFMHCIKQMQPRSRSVKRASSELLSALRQSISRRVNSLAKGG